MDATTEVIRAAEARAEALASGDVSTLRDLLHDEFRWVSHTGERFDRETYVEIYGKNGADGSERELTEISVVAHPQTAVLRCTVVESVDHGHGPREYRMPMTQVWVLRDERWLCLAGHAGARS